MTHSCANVLCLSICMLGNCSCFNFRLLTFFKTKFLQINHPGPQSECQTVWIQIKIVSEYDQEIPQSQTTDNSMAPRGRATQTFRDTRETN